MALSRRCQPVIACLLTSIALLAALSGTASARRGHLRFIRAPKAQVRSSTATFVWTGAPKGASCQVDSHKLVKCRRSVTLRRLSIGRHKFVVRSAHRSAERTWKVMSRLMAPPPLPVANSSTAPLIGINARLEDLTATQLAATVAQLKSAGIGVVRVDVEWASLEPQNGVFAWAAMDRWVLACARAGIQIVGVVDDAPPWATGAWNAAPTIGAAETAYARFVKELVYRYGTEGVYWRAHPNIPVVPIVYWDIWNEPYVPQFWARNFPDPAGYAEMFKTVVETARPEDPNARFLLEADTRVISMGWPWKPFLTSMFDAVPDLGNYAYAVSVHPYQGDGGSPATCTPFTPSRGVQQDWRATVLQFCRIADIRRILNAYGAQNVKIWITELGWSTAPAAPDSVSEATQAAYTSEAFNLLRTTYENMVSGLVWYEYESPEQDPASQNDYFGFVHPNGKPKPAWTALVQGIQQGI